MAHMHAAAQASRHLPVRVHRAGPYTPCNAAMRGKGDSGLPVEGLREWLCVWVGRVVYGLPPGRLHREQTRRTRGEPWNPRTAACWPLTVSGTFCLHLIEPAAMQASGCAPSTDTQSQGITSAAAGAAAAAAAGVLLRCAPWSARCGLAFCPSVHLRVHGVALHFAQACAP